FVRTSSATSCGAQRLRLESNVIHVPEGGGREYEAVGRGTNRRHMCQVTTCIRHRRGADVAARDRTARRTPLASTTSARARHPPSPRFRDEAGLDEAPFTRLSFFMEGPHRQSKYPVESWSSPREQDEDSSRPME